MVLSRRIPIIFSGDFLRFPKPSPYRIFVSLYDRGGYLLLYEGLCIGSSLCTCLWTSFGVLVCWSLAIPYVAPHSRAPNHVPCLWTCSWCLFGELGWVPVYGTRDFHGGLDSGPGNGFPKRAPYQSLSGYPVIVKTGRGKLVTYPWAFVNPQRCPIAPRLCPLMGSHLLPVAPICSLWLPVAPIGSLWLPVTF